MSNPASCELCCDDIDCPTEVHLCPSSEHKFCTSCVRDIIKNQTDISDLELDVDKWRRTEGRAECPFDKACGIFSEEKLISSEGLLSPKTTLKYINSSRQFARVTGEENGRKLALEEIEKLEKQSKADKWIDYIRSTILTKRCPNPSCNLVWDKFTGCVAITCPACKCFFCALCLRLFNSNRACHSHGAKCTGMNDVFMSESQLKIFNATFIEIRILSLLPSIEEDVRLQVALVIQTDLAQGDISSNKLITLINRMIEGDFSTQLVDDNTSKNNIIMPSPFKQNDQRHHQPVPAVAEAIAAPAPARRIRRDRRLGENPPSPHARARPICQFCNRNARYEVVLAVNQTVCLRHARRMTGVRNIDFARSQGLVRNV